MQTGRRMGVGGCSCRRMTLDLILGTALALALGAVQAGPAERSLGWVVVFLVVRAGLDWERSVQCAGWYCGWSRGWCPSPRVGFRTGQVKESTRMAGIDLSLQTSCLRQGAVHRSRIHTMERLGAARSLSL